MCCYQKTRNRIDSARARGLLARYHKREHGKLQENGHIVPGVVDMHREKSVRHFQEAICEMREVAPNHCLLKEWAQALEDMKSSVDTPVHAPTKRDEGYRQTIDEFLEKHCKYYAGPYTVKSAEAECTTLNDKPEEPLHVHKTRQRIYSGSVKRRRLLERVDDKEKLALRKEWKRALTKETKPEGAQGSHRTICEGTEVVIGLVSMSSHSFKHGCACVSQAKPFYLLCDDIVDGRIFDDVICNLKKKVRSHK